MTDAERVLEVLLHDLRTPIGVAQGYLRLLQDGRLTAGADTERAIAKALQALGQTARLCESASAFLDTRNATNPPAQVAVSTLVSQVEANAKSRNLAIESGKIPADATLAVTGSVGAISEAIVLILSTSGTRRQTIHITASEEELKFIGSNGADLSALNAAPVPTDHWWSQGLAIAVASRRIARSSGELRSFPGGGALMVALPFEGRSV